MQLANCPKKLDVKNGVILWPLTSSKIIVLVAQPISTDSGPPAWAVDKRAKLGWLRSRGKGWPVVCKSGSRLCSFTVCPLSCPPERYLIPKHLFSAHKRELMNHCSSASGIMSWRFFGREDITAAKVVGN